MWLRYIFVMKHLKVMLLFLQNKMKCKYIIKKKTSMTFKYETVMEKNFKSRKFYPLSYFFFLKLCMEETSSCLPSHPVFLSSLTESQFLANQSLSRQKLHFPASCVAVWPHDYFLSKIKKA